MLTRVKRILVVTFVAGMAPTVLGQGVGNGSPTETSLPLSSIYQIPEDPPLLRASTGYGSWIPVSLDPDGPTWDLHLVTASGSLVSAGNHVILAEYLLITGEYPWTGWRQALLTPGLGWLYGHTGTVGPTPSVLVNGAPPSGLEIDLSNDSLSLSFDPLGPGTRITIVSEMVYSGSQELDSPIDIQQFPTPEPTLMTLVGMAIAMVAGCRRAWR